MAAHWLWPHCGRLQCVDWRAVAGDVNGAFGVAFKDGVVEFDDVGFGLVKDFRKMLQKGGLGGIIRPKGEDSAGKEMGGEFL